MGNINLSISIYMPYYLRNINLLFSLIMKHYKIISGKKVEINIKNLWNYFNYNTIWLYDNNLNKIGILYFN